jgi:flagellar protein FliO/FliZ
MIVYKKYYIVLLIICLFVLPMFTQPVHAQSSNVLDCIENEENCEEEEIDSSVETDNTNDGDLVGGETLQSTSLFFNIVKMIVALLFVLALIYGIMLVLKKRNKLMQHNGLIENLGGISVGPNKSIQLIRIGSHIYVVGVGEHVELMLEIKEPEVIEALLVKEDREGQESLLGQLFQRERKTENDNNEPFFDQLKNELNKLQTNRDKLIHNSDKKDDEHE